MGIEKLAKTIKSRKWLAAPMLICALSTPTMAEQAQSDIPPPRYGTVERLDYDLRKATPEESELPLLQAYKIINDSIEHRLRQDAPEFMSAISDSNRSRVRDVCSSAADGRVLDWSDLILFYTDERGMDLPNDSARYMREVIGRYPHAPENYGQLGTQSKLNLECGIALRESR